MNSRRFLRRICHPVGVLARCNPLRLSKGHSLYADKGRTLQDDPLEQVFAQARDVEGSVEELLVDDG